MTYKQLTIIFLLIFLTFGIYYWYKNTPKEKLTVTTNSLSETKVPETKVANAVGDYQLPKGEQIYNLSHGDKVVGPRASKISYKPLAFAPGESQTISVTFPDSETVSSAILFITTDNFEDQRVKLQRDGNQKGNVWVGNWTPNDTINQRYSVRYYFVGPSGTYNNPAFFL